MSEDGQTHIETIQLDVVCPKQDFSAHGGIADALAALKNLDAYYTQLNAKFSAGFKFGGSGGTVTSAGEIKLNISGSAIHAALIPGEKIALNLSGKDFVISGTAGGAGGAVTPPSAGGTGSGMPKPITPGSSGSGRLLLEVTDEGAEGPSIRKRRYAAGNFDRSFREITYGKEEEVKSSVLYDKPSAEGAAGVSTAILAKKDELQQAILKGTENEVGARRLLAEAIRAEVAASKELNDLQVARYGAMASKLDLSASGLAKRQGDRQMIRQFREHLASQDAAQESAVEQASRSNKARSLMRARSQAQQDAAQESRETIVQDALHDVEIRSRRQRLQSTQFGPATPQRERERMDREADARHHRNMQLAHEDAARWLSGQPGHEGSVGKYSKIALGHEEKGVEATNAATLANDRFNESTRLIGKNMLQNIKHVTTWAASVGVLYGSIRLLTRSLEENMEIGKQQAILSQIFKGNSDEVTHLTNSVLELAAANGQSASEAMQSAVEWARIFHTENEIIQATNASLIEANVSGEEAAKTTEFLSMMVQVYGLRASELVKVIGEMAAISQTANISNLDLMKGMEAVGEAAKEAGMSWSQTLGVITGGVSATKQSGTTIANTLKTMITQMANPEIQDKMRLGFGLEVTKGMGSGDIKSMPQILSQMQQAWEKMTEAERRSLLFSVGGRQNATRMAGILDEFIYGQIKAINAQLNLNAAEQENEKIVNTLKGQVGALAAEWDKFVNIQGARGPIMALTDMTSALKNLLLLLSAPGLNVLTTLFGTVGLATGARMMISGFRSNAMTSEAGGVKGGVVVSTVRALKGDLAALKTVFNETAAVGQERFLTMMALVPGTAVKARESITGMSLATRALGVSFAALTDIVLPILAIWGAIKLFNYDMQQFPGSADEQSKWSTMQDVEATASTAHSTRASLLAEQSSLIGDPRISSARKKEMAENLAALELPEGNSAQLAAQKKHIEGLIEEGKALELVVELNQAAAQAMRDSTASRTSAISAAQIQINTDKDQIAVLEKGRQINYSYIGTYGAWQFGHRYAGPTSDDEKTVEQLKKDMADRRKFIQDLQQQQMEDVTNEDFTKSLIKSRAFGVGREISIAGISSMANALPALTPMDERNRKIAELMAQKRLLDAGHAFYAFGGGIEKAVPNVEERNRLREEERAARIKVESELREQALGIGYDTGLTRQQAYNRFGQAEFGGFAIGLTPGEQMEQQQIRGRGRLGQIGGEMKDALGRGSREEARSLEAEDMQITYGMLKNIQDAHGEIVKLQTEEVNLAMRLRMEFERSMLVSSPEQLLQKMAALTMARDGNMTAGQFFSMGQDVRRNIMELPAYNPEMRNLRRGLGAMQREFEPGGSPSAFGAGNAAVRGTSSIGRYGGMMPGTAPSINVSPIVVAMATAASAATNFAHAVGAAADHVRRVAAGASGGRGSSGGSGGAPHNAQSGSHAAANMAGYASRNASGSYNTGPSHHGNYDTRSLPDWVTSDPNYEYHGAYVPHGTPDTIYPSRPAPDPTPADDGTRHLEYLQRLYDSDGGE